MGMVDSTIKKIALAKKQCQKVLAESKYEMEREDAELLMEQLERLVNSMVEYTDVVFDHNMSKATRENSYSNSENLLDTQKEMEKIERRRKICHDALITDVRMTDSACRLVGVDEIYGKLPKEYQNDSSGLLGDENRKNPGVVETRHAIADWAWDFVLGCTVAFQLDLEDMNYQKNLNDREKISETYKKTGGAMGAKKQIKDIVSFER